MTDGQQTAAGGPKPNWRPLGPGETVYILNDMVPGPEETRDISPVIHKQEIKTISGTAPWSAPAQIPENIETIICETTERLVRDMAPGIIEKVIREEIQKLKMESS